MQIDLSQFRAAFYVEADEHLQHMEGALLQLESQPGDVELLNTVFRAAHSIKGASTTFGIDEVGKFTHVLENLLEKARDGELNTTPELIELLLSSVDIIYGLVANAKDGAPLPENLEQVFEELQRVNGSTVSTPAPISVKDNYLNQNQGSEGGSGVICYRVSLNPSPEFFHFGQDPLLLLRELNELSQHCRIILDQSQLPPLSDLDPERCYLRWVIELETAVPEEQIRDVFMFLDSDSSYQIEPISNGPNKETAEDDKAEFTETPSPAGAAPATESPSGRDVVSAASAGKAKDVRADSKTLPTRSNGELETVRVDRERLDELINQIGELVIGASMVEQEVNQVTGGRSLESLAALGKIVRDLQEMSLGLRMVPIAATFQKMNRVIRDVAKKLNKKIEFTTEGDETELDKTVVDQISDPLVHMVRNAADHGIESPEDRILSGKPETGTVNLRAFQQGGNVYIELRDDGRGLNRKKILEKAIERGVVPPDANLSDNEICGLIFQPGFSTADTVTDVSGRGVGMDVVRRNVEALQGSVSIRSEEGKGSVLSVRLPLTLAILDGLLIRLSSEVFVIPLLSVIESICVQPNEIKQIVSVGEVIQLRGEIVPLVRLHDRLGIHDADSSRDQSLLVIVEDQGRRFALCVDELLGQQQVVIKNLETNFRKVPGVAGATILGDGRVALILDVYGVSNVNGQEARHLDHPKDFGTTEEVA
ncbi:chemotaxis protein CheA [Pirellulaceae bacterium SH449]